MMFSVFCSTRRIQAFEVTWGSEAPVQPPVGLLPQQDEDLTGLFER